MIMQNPREEGVKLQTFDVGPCENGYQIGFLIGQKFSTLIKSRLARDLILHNQLLPFAKSLRGESLIRLLSENNKNRFPRYWDELVGIAEGSGVPVTEIILINFRKEILPFTAKRVPELVDGSEDCSDVLVVADTMAVVAHNEDANVALVGHTYIIKAMMPDGLSFVAYTYAGELPSCAFGFNNHGMAFTLDSVPPTEDEIVKGGIGRNFVSRDLLEATCMRDALARISASQVSVGHSYNLVDLQARRVLNIETASGNRASIREIDETPFFHANMYLHLDVPQVNDENSIARQRRADILPKLSKEDLLAILGDTEDSKYPIYMTGPRLHTLCTAVIDLDAKKMTIMEGNPNKKRVSHVFYISTRDPIP